MKTCLYACVKWARDLIRIWTVPTDTRRAHGKDHSMDPLNHNGNQHTEIVIIAHQKRQFLRSVASPLFCMCNISELVGLESVAYSGFDQSRPAGHNKALVHLWLKLWSTFTLHARGGTRLCPLGVIQSRTVPLRLLVSPSNSSNGQTIYQLRDNINLSFQTFHQAFFQTRNQPQKLLKDAMFMPLPVTILSWLLSFIC